MLKDCQKIRRNFIYLKSQFSAYLSLDSFYLDRVVYDCSLYYVIVICDIVNAQTISSLVVEYLPSSLPS